MNAIQAELSTVFSVFSYRYTAQGGVALESTVTFRSDSLAIDHALLTAAQCDGVAVVERTINMDTGDIVATSRIYEAGAQPSAQIRRTLMMAR